MHSSPKGHKEKRNGQVYDSQVLEEVHSMPERATQGGQGRMQAEEGTCVHWGPWDSALWFLS